jgi:hypothetical protein
MHGPTYHGAEHLLVDVADVAPWVDHADERTASLAEHEFPLGVRRHVAQPAFGGQQHISYADLKSLDKGEDALSFQSTQHEYFARAITGLK